MTFRSKPLPLAAFLLGVSLSVGACSSEPPARSDESAPTRAVQFETAGEISMPSVHSYSGSVEGARRVTLSTRIMGRVVQLDVDEGDEVREGDVLLRIDDGQLAAQRRQAEADLRQARARLENARTNFNRFETLLGQGSATQREFDDASTALESAEAGVQSLENRIAEIDDGMDYTVIRAPVSGVVALKSIEQGAMATPGTPLMIVETLDRLKVVASVPESDVNRLAAGQEVRVRVDAVGVTLPGVIEEINRAAAGPGRSYTLRVVFSERRAGEEDDQTAGVRPGMFAHVTVPSAESGRGIAVPEQAIIRRGQLTGIHALTADDRVVLRWVRLGRSSDGLVEVLSGLTAGERYILGEGERLEDGQLVIATSADEHSPKSTQ